MAVEHEARLERIVEHGLDTRSLFLRLPVPLRFLPGQFISCRLPVGDTVLTRPYSIASDPESPELLELLLDLVPGGAGSQQLFALRIGSPVRYTGPWGTFVVEEAPAAETVFIADGTGIAPIRPMLRRATATAVRPITLVYAATRPERRIYEAELRALRPSPSVVAVPSGHLVAEVERRFVTGDADRTRHFFVCGVGELVHTLRDHLRAAGYQRRAVRYERW